jgi:polar amino acid transport system substrate-binding protein
MIKLKLFFIIIFIIFNFQLKAIEKVTIQLDWLNQFQFAGYYIAKEKGYFQEENLDVTIKEFNSGINILNDVLTSKTQYAVGKSSLIIDKLEGKDIVLLSAIYQSSPMVVVTLKKSNITSPTLLKNKKVMLTPDARSAASINSMLISQGVNLKDINFLPHSFKLDDLISGKTDAMGCYLSNEPFILKQKGIEFDILNPSDYGFNFYGGLFYTSKKELNEHPIRVRKMYKAVMKGWAYAFTHIRETANIIYKKYNTQNKTLPSLLYEGNVLKKLADFNDGKLGNIASQRIEEIKRLYLLLGVVNNPSDYKANDIIYDPSKINLTKEEIAYLKTHKMKLISNSNYPPFTIKEGDKVSGLEIDYWNLINKKLQTKVNLEIINDSSQSMQKIKENTNNVRYAYNRLDYKKNYTQTTNVIDYVKIGFSTLMDKPYISDETELTNKKVAIVKYSNLYDRLKKRYPYIDFVEVKNLKRGLKLIEEKKVYGVIAKLPALVYNIRQKKYNNLKISGIFDIKFNMKLSVNKGNYLLLNILNKAISAITDNDREKINNKYFSIIYEIKPDYSWMYKVFTFLILIILIILFINRKLKREIKKRKTVEKELFKVANIDSLTNIYNRRKIESLYNAELLRVKRYKRDMSIIFFDVDNFKQINDELGHSVGDEVLEKMSQMVKNSIRKTDYFGRWGGEEFFIILPETTKDQAANIAYILKDRISTIDFSIEKTVTCSFGVSQYEETDSADSLLTRADNAMYYIKRNGKNSVKVV